MKMSGFYFVHSALQRLIKHSIALCMCVGLWLSLISLPLFAAWQVAKPATTLPREPFFQAGRQHKETFTPVTYHHRPAAYGRHSFPSQYANLGQPAPIYAVSISGSLKENIERIMNRYHWKVIWKAPYDYNFDGKVTGSSLPNVVEKLLQPFPLQAVMYMSNRTLAIVPRAKP